MNQTYKTIFFLVNSHVHIKRKWKKSINTWERKKNIPNVQTINAPNGKTKEAISWTGIGVPCAWDSWYTVLADLLLLTPPPLGEEAAAALILKHFFVNFSRKGVSWNSPPSLGKPDMQWNSWLLNAWFLLYVP